MKQNRQNKGMSRAASLLAVAVVSALIGGIGGQILAQMKGPTEHKDTVHWFYNRGNVAATALVCGIAPSE
jgi:hypothetical protein